MKTKLISLRSCLQLNVGYLENEKRYIDESKLCETDKETLFSIIDTEIKNAKIQIDYINGLLK